MTEKGKQYWNDQAYSWGDSRGLGDLAGEVRKCIRRELELFLPFEGDLILNLGAGNDIDSLNMWDMRKVVSLDYARNMLKGNKLAVEADLRNNLPFLSESVGMVCSFFLMRYLTLHEQQKLIVESSRVLRQGGILVIIDVPDNHHVCQVEKFDPLFLGPVLENIGMKIIKIDVEERNFGKYISTGFGGWYENGSYKIGTLVAMKL